MSASRKTIEALGHILVDEIGLDRARAITDKVMTVDGNWSFKKTIMALQVYLATIPEAT